MTGIVSRSDGSAHAFTYTVAGGMVDIGSLGGTIAVGNGIDRAGDVAGYSTKADGTYHAFLYRNGKMKDIGDLGGGSASAYALNDDAIVVGSAYTADDVADPFLYKQGKMKDLGTLGSHAQDDWNNAAGINDSQQVVGISYDTLGNFLGFFWSKGQDAEPRNARRRLERCGRHQRERGRSPGKPIRLGTCKRTRICGAAEK